MLHGIASKITEQLVKNNTDDQDMIDIYIYGTECILNSSITIFFIIIASFFMHQFPQILIWLGAFVLLRNHFGGYHAPNHFLCITIYSLLGITAMLFHHFPIYSDHLFVLILYIISVLYTVFLVPVNNPKKHLSDHRKHIEKLKSIIILLIEFTICFFLATSWTSYITISTLDTILLSFISILSDHTHSFSQSTRHE